MAKFNINRSVHCPKCEADITDGEFTIESRIVNGYDDWGYECKHCGIVLYRWKIERVARIRDWLDDLLRDLDWHLYCIAQILLRRN